MGYENGKIYKLWSNEGNDIYIGSTINTLTKRLNQHINQHKNKHTSSSLLYDKYENVQIELIENFSCKDKNELTAREGYHIRNTNCVNKHIPCRSSQERYNDNKQHKLQYQKEYYDNHKKEKGDYMKEYYENNKKDKKEYQREYNDAHKKEISEYKKERQKLTFHCDICNCDFKKTGYSKHIKTKKHILNSSV